MRSKPILFTASRMHSASGGVRASHALVVSWEVRLLDLLVEGFDAICDKLKDARIARRSLQRFTVTVGAVDDNGVTLPVLEK